MRARSIDNLQVSVAVLMNRTRQKSVNRSRQGFKCRTRRSKRNSMEQRKVKRLDEWIKERTNVKIVKRLIRAAIQRRYRARPRGRLPFACVHVAQLHHALLYCDRYPQQSCNEGSHTVISMTSDCYCCRMATNILRVSKGERMRGRP
jgi:hypothetical protein